MKKLLLLVSLLVISGCNGCHKHCIVKEVLDPDHAMGIRIVPKDVRSVPMPVPVMPFPPPPEPVFKMWCDVEGIERA